MAHSVADFEDYNPLNQTADITADLIDQNLQVIAHEYLLLFIGETLILK